MIAQHHVGAERWRIDVDGIDGWVPVRLDLDRDELEADLRSRMAGHDDSAVPLLVTLAARMHEGASDDPARLIALWARYDVPTRIVPLTMATLRLVGVEPDSDDDTFAEALVSAWPVRAAVIASDIATASGPARHLRALTGTADGSAFEAQREDVVFWLRPGQGECLLLSSTTLDLARGEELGQELDQLAAGVRGFGG